MKILKTEKLKDGRTVHRVEVDSDEELISVKRNTFYRLGLPLDDVIHSDMLIEMRQVVWCSVSQEWVMHDRGHSSCYGIIID